MARICFRRQKTILTVGSETRPAILGQPSHIPSEPDEAAGTLEEPIGRHAKWVKRTAGNVIHLIAKAPASCLAKDHFTTGCGWKFAYAICQYEFLNELPENHEFRSCLRCLPELRGMDGSLVESESSHSNPLIPMLHSGYSHLGTAQSVDARAQLQSPSGTADHLPPTSNMAMRALQYS